MDKATLREEYLRRRLELDAATRDAYSKAILSHFDTLSFTGVRHLFSYSALASRHEFDPGACVENLKKKNPDLRVALPRLKDDGRHMDAIQILPDTMYKVNAFGIPDPVSGMHFEPAGLDMIFVPLVIVDGYGNRIGYGKGFYDRYLSSCRAEAVKIGFSYFEPVGRIKDISQFDVPLNLCITPLRIYEF